MDVFFFYLFGFLWLLVECLNLEVNNINVIIMDNLFGGYVVSFICKGCYRYISGDLECMCNRNGMWIGILFVCKGNLMYLI